jgi:hypothetical protein
VADHLAGCPACALELADLRCFAAALKHFGPVLLEDHLAAETLVEYAWNQASVAPHVRDRVIRHLALCRTCRLEYKILLRVNESLEVARDQGRSDAAAASAPSIESVPSPRLRARLLSVLRRWPVWAAVVAAVIVVGALWMVIKPTFFSLTGHQKTADLVPVEAYYPTGEVAEPPQLFRWAAVPGAKGYRLSLYTPQMEMIWRSQRTATNWAVLPSEVAGQLNRNQSYLWQVFIYFGQGQVNPSPLFEFAIQEK